MKSKIVMTVLIVNNLLFNNYIPVQSQSLQESVFETVNIPNSNLAGINPEDIIYSNNKFYVWGLGAIIVIDAENLTVLKTLILSNSAQYDYQSDLPLIWDSPHSKMAYNGTDRIYALSPDNKIYIIDTQTDSFLNSIIEKPSNIPSYFFTNSIIRFDSKNNRLLWSISWMDNYSVPHVHMEYYNLEDDIPEQIWQPPVDMDYTLISDIVFNKFTNYLYLSYVNNKIEICPTDLGVFYVEETINTTGPNSDFLYITPTEGNELHRIYCLSYNKIYWINGADNYNGSFAAGANDLKCLAYNPQCNKLYISGNTNAYIYEVSEPQSSPLTISLDINGNDEIAYHLEYFYDRIYACKSGEIVTIAADNTVTNLIQKKNNYFYSGAYDPTNQKILFCNTMGAGVEIVDAPQTYNGDQIITGISVFRSTYNSANRKFYFYNDDLHDDSKLTILEYSNNSYQIEEIIPFINNISSCVHNTSQSSHHVLISSFSPTNQIIKLNAVNNESEGILYTENEFCENIFISPEPNNKIYCATGMNSLQSAAIEVFNANDYSEDIILQNLGNNDDPIDYRMKFCFDTKDNLVFFILYKRNYDPNNQWGFLGKIDINDEENPLTLIELEYSPEKILYAECLNIIFIKNTNSRFVTYFNSDNLTLPQYNVFPEGTIIMDIEYGDCNFNNSLYILGSNGICRNWLPYGYEVIHQWEMSEYVTSMRYNPIDKRLYVFSPYRTDKEHKSWMYFIDPLTAEIYDEQLPNTSIWRYEDYLTNNEMIVDISSGRLLCPNGSHSNISVSPENLVIQPRIWNWISFPRLEYQQIFPELILTNINPFPPPNYLYFKNLPLQNETTDILVEYNYEDGSWEGDMTEINSVFGYKLLTDYAFQSYLPLSGNIIASSTTFNIFDQHPNWVGYFILETQSPFDAIGGEFLEHINMLKGQYWSCIKKDPGHTKSSESIWACACQQGRVEIKYGEMIEIYPTEDIPEFHWQMAGMQPESEPKPSSLSFQYEEQSEYDAIFIELDSLDLPDEIGAFAGDSCIGATTVLPSDTMALICAYTEGFEGEEITFELLYPTKSARPRCRDYSVLNTTTGIREKRRIVAGENQPYFLVSLKSQENIPAEEPALNVQVRPNPVDDELTVSYFNGLEVSIELSLINALGLPVRSWQRGVQGAGNYSMTISLAGLPSGCYYLKVKAGNAAEMQKIMIIH